jgi:uncharacterized protein (TIGR02996 family)
MSDELAFLTAICTTPADDTARLVYADWLDEHGRGERAELIRVQCEQAKTPEPELKTVVLWADRHATYPGGMCYACRKAEPLRCEYHTLELRWRGLLADTAFDWSGAVPRSWGREFSRGFVSHVTCSAADWLRHADSLHWHPSQAAECPECDGEVWAETREYTRAGSQCSHCDGTGRVTRPCPPTAQPIESVTLTTSPGAGWQAVELFRPNLDAGQTYSHPRWPGVTFRLPFAAP